MAFQEKNTPHMIYSPEKHIPLFEAVTTETGARAIRVKRNKAYEVVTLDTLLALVLQNAGPKLQAELPMPEEVRQSQ